MRAGQALDSEIEITESSKKTYDLAIGGTYYAHVQAVDVRLTCYPKDIDQLNQVGREI
ncbi:MAG: hypothetical protein V3W20_14205 [Candidatus Neomarinimicrobiota bacterium]